MKTTRSSGKHSGELKRREFLQRAGSIALGTAALQLCPLRLSAADIQSLTLKNLGEKDALVLAQVSRLLFPHDALEQAVYLGVVRDIDLDIERDHEPAKLVQGISALLDKKSGGDWSAAGNEKQVAILKAMQGDELFNYLHRRSIDSLYQDPVVWDLLGYQGSSVEHGGYLYRGFNDIDWLE